MNLKSVGDSVTVILRDNTRPDQAQTIITFYRVRGDQSDSMQVRQRKIAFLDTHTVISAWGSQKFQLYHMYNLANDQEEIIVYYYRYSNDQS